MNFVPSVRQCVYVHVVSGVILGVQDEKEKYFGRNIFLPSDIRHTHFEGTAMRGWRRALALGGASEAAVCGGTDGVIGGGGGMAMMLACSPRSLDVRP